jgi:hypothetical protein
VVLYSTLHTTNLTRRTKRKVLALGMYPFPQLGFNSEGGEHHGGEGGEVTATAGSEETSQHTKPSNRRSTTCLQQHQQHKFADTATRGQEGGFFPPVMQLQGANKPQPASPIK